MNNEEEKQGESLGFSGLSSMVSNVDDVCSKPTPSSQVTFEPPIERNSGVSQQQKPTNKKSQESAPVKPPKSYDPWTVANVQPSGGISIGWWILGVSLMILVIWEANHQDGITKSESSSGSSSAATKANQPVVLQPSRPSESKPSFGRNQVLSTEELRYCLAEKIRLDSGESILNNYSDSDVNSFNNYVDDYNRRCGEFRYRQGTLESARRDVEPYRNQLQIEGQNRFVSNSVSAVSKPLSKSVSSSGSKSVSKPSMPDVTVLAIQRHLNELGYNAGKPDGFFGSKTRSAIEAYQLAIGISIDGIADIALLRSLERVVKSNSELSSKKSSAQARTPTNAWVSGSTWYCNDGYRKIGNRCDKLSVPTNAWVSGSTWYCNDGYRKAGDRCDKFNVPANAWVSGSKWYCNDGFKKVGESCISIFME